MKPRLRAGRSISRGKNGGVFLCMPWGHARNLPAFWGAEAVSQRPDISGEEFGVERVGWRRDGSPGKLFWLP